MAGHASCGAQQDPNQCNGPAGFQSVGKTGSGQHNGSSSLPNLPAMPPEAPPNLPTSPQPAPALLQELPSMRAMLVPRPFSAGDLEAQAHTGEANSAVVQT